MTFVLFLLCNKVILSCLAAMSTDTEGGDGSGSPGGGAAEEEQEEVDDSGVGILAMECVVWDNQEYINSQGVAENRIEWTVVVGDSSGRIHLIDITEVSFHY